MENTQLVGAGLVAAGSLALWMLVSELLVGYRQARTRRGGRRR